MNSKVKEPKQPLSPENWKKPLLTACFRLANESLHLQFYNHVTYNGATKGKGKGWKEKEQKYNRKKKSNLNLFFYIRRQQFFNLRKYLCIKLSLFIFNFLVYFVQCAENICFLFRAI